jgi:hypothetical protein
MPIEEDGDNCDSKWAIPCTHVTLQDGIAAIEGGCFDLLGAPSLPAPIEFIAFARVLGMPEEFTEEADRDVEVYLTGPGMEPLVSLQFEVPTSEPGPDHAEGWEMNAMIPIVIQFTAQAEGAHMIDFYVNGRVQRCPIPFRVLVQPAAG